MGSNTINKLPEEFILDDELPEGFVLDEPIKPLSPAEEERQIKDVVKMSEKTGVSPARLMRRQTMINDLFNQEEYQEAAEQRREEKKDEGIAGYWSELLDATARGTARVGGAFKNAQAFMSKIRTTPLGPSILESPESKQFRAQRATEYEKEADLLWEVAKHPELAAQDEGKINKAINLIGETIPYITATTAAYVVAGPMGGFAVGSMVEGNSAYKTAEDFFVKQNNGNPMTPSQEKKAKVIGVGVGIVSGAIEAFGGRYAEQLLLKTTAKLKSKLAKAGAVFAIGTAVEALEEGAQEIAAIVGEETYRDVNWNEAATRIAGSMAGGAFLGGAMRGASMATKRLTQFPDKPLAERGMKPVVPTKEHAKLEEELTEAIQERTGLPEEQARTVAQDAIDDKFYAPPEEKAEAPPIKEAVKEPPAEPTVTPEGKLPPHLQAIADKAKTADVTITDVTPEGYGPSETGEPVPSTQLTTEQQRLLNTINEAKTILKGDVSGEKRKSIERSLAKAEKDYKALAKPAPAEAKGKGEVEAIRAAAFYNPNTGKTGEGRTHGEAAANLEGGITVPEGQEPVQEGFVTTTGRFVSNEEAAEIAKKSKQLSKDYKLTQEERILGRPTAQNILKPVPRPKETVKKERDILGGVDPIVMINKALVDAVEIRPKVEAERKVELRKRVGAAAGTLESVSYTHLTLPTILLV